MKEIILGIWLMVLGAIDFKEREIPICLFVIGAAIGFCFLMIEPREIYDLCVACIPGGVCLIFSWITKEVLGLGDGVAIFVMGIYISLEQLISLVLAAFGIAGVVALFFLVILRKNGHYQMPFIPFLGIAYWLEVWMI